MKGENTMFLIIDGSALLTSCFFATCSPSIMSEKDIDKKNAMCRSQLKQNRKGVYTNAVEPFLTMILKYIRDYKPDHMAVCFDESHITFRTYLYPDYKAQRDPKPDALKEQKATIMDILNHIGIPCFSDPVYEADDIAGTIAKKFADPFEPVILLTKDHDWLQLIDDNISVWMMMASEDIAFKQREALKRFAAENDILNAGHMPHKCVFFNEAATEASEGVIPKRIAALKGLAGDKSDNIPGVPKLGPKTAAILLGTETCNYPSVSAIFAELDECGPDSKFYKIYIDMLKNYGVRGPEGLVARMNENRELALLSEKLATIYTQIPKYLESKISDYDYELKADMLEKAKSWFEIDP